MYVPAHFRQDDLEEIKRLIRANDFVTLVAQSAEGPVASHLPVELEEHDDGTLCIAGHLAKANPLWKSFGDAADVLVIVSGPHAFVSPEWYEKPAVPTWNYQAVHLSGRAVVTDEAGLRAILASLVSRYYRPCTALDMARVLEVGESAVDGLVRGVVGFRMVVERIDAAWKLSQNRSAADFTGVLEHLSSAKHAGSNEVAAAMERVAALRPAAAEDAMKRIVDGWHATGDDVTGRGGE